MELWSQETRRIIPDFEAFYKFIIAFCNAEEQASSSSTSITDKPKSSRRLFHDTVHSLKEKTEISISTCNYHKRRSQQPTKVREKKCFYCDIVGHYLTICDKFKELTAKDRVEIVAQRKLYAFIVYGHIAIRICVIRRPCKIWKKGHNTLLYIQW